MDGFFFFVFDVSDEIVLGRDKMMSLIKSFEVYGDRVFGDFFSEAGIVVI